MPNGFSMMMRAQLPLQVWIQSGGFEILQNSLELVRAGRKIKKTVAARAMAFVELFETFRLLLVSSFITKLAPVIEDRLRKRFPDFVAHGLTRKFPRGFLNIACRNSSSLLSRRANADDDHARWQFAVGRKIIKRRDKFPMCEIARSAEDHDAAWLRHGRVPTDPSRSGFGSG